MSPRCVIHIVVAVAETSEVYYEHVIGRCRRADSPWTAFLWSYGEPDRKLVGQLKETYNRSVNDDEWQGVVESWFGPEDPFGFLRRVWRSTRELAQSEVRAVVHLHHPVIAGVLAACSALLLNGLPTVFTVHSMFGRYRWRNKLLSAVAFVASDKAAFVSQAAAAAYPGFLKRLKVEGESWHVIPNGVDLRYIDASRTSGETVKRKRGDLEMVSNWLEQREDVVVLVSVGRLIGLKRHDFLVSVLDSLPGRFKLVIAGDGPRLAELQEQARRLQLEKRVRFLGEIARGKVFELLWCSDMFLSASTYEGMPLALLEAMATGLPVCVSDITAHREVELRTEVVEGESEMILLPLVVEMWQKAIEGVWEKGRIRGEEQHWGNRQIVEDGFSVSAMLARYGRLYESVR